MPATTARFGTTKASRVAAGLLSDAFEQMFSQSLQSASTQFSAQPAQQPVKASERISSLESRVQTVEAQNLLLAQQLTAQGTAYATLLKAHNMLLEDAADNQRKLDRLERLVLDLYKDKPSQGEIMIYHRLCKEDELRKKQRQDRDDDPDAQKESEPTGPSKTGERATTQGESTAGTDIGGTSGSGVGEAGEKTSK